MNVCVLVDFLEELFSREVDILTPMRVYSIKIKQGMR